MCHSCYSSGAHALSIRHYVIVSCVALLLAFACPAGASGVASTPDQVAVKEAEEAPTTLPAVDPTEDHAADSSIDASKRARSERSKRQSSGIPQRQRSSVAAPRTSVVEQLEKSTRPRSKKGKPLQYALLALELSIYAFVVYFTYTQLDCHFNKKCPFKQFPFTIYPFNRIQGVREIQEAAARQKRRHQKLLAAQARKQN